MADGFALALQAGLKSALVADAGVAALIAGRMYDEPPSDVVFPYLRFGDISPDAFDTDSKKGSLVQIGLVAHSQSAAGRVEATRVIEAAMDALHQQESSITVVGFTLVEMIFQTYVTRRNPEGRGHTATMALRAMLEEA